MWYQIQCSLKNWIAIDQLFTFNSLIWTWQHNITLCDSANKLVSLGNCHYQGIHNYMQIKCQANNRICNHDIDFIDFTHIRENHSFNNTCILKCVKMNTFPIYINLKIDNNSFSIKNTQGFIKLDSLKYISPGSFPYQLFGINNISNSMSNIAIHFLAQSTSLTKSECNQEEKKRLRFSKFQFRWKSINS